MSSEKTVFCVIENFKTLDDKLVDNILLQMIKETKGFYLNQVKKQKKNL